MMRVQILGGKRSSFPVELNLWLGCDTLLCLFSYQALSSGFKPTSNNQCRGAAQLLSFSLTCWLTPLFPILISLPLIHHLLPLALCFWIFVTYTHSLSPSTPCFFSSSLSGCTEGCGIGPGPPGFHSDTLCPDVISIDGVQLVLAILAQGLFTVYPKLKTFAERLLCVCV